MVKSDEFKSLQDALQKCLTDTSDYEYALEESSIVAVTDHKGIITHANDNFCQISKYSLEELVGQDHRIINSGFHTKDFISILWKTITKGKIWQGELKNKAKDGTMYWVDTRIVPVLNEKGKPIRYVVIRVDITNRKLLEEDLKAAHQRLLFHLGNTTLGFIEWDNELHLKSLSTKAEKMFGWSLKGFVDAHKTIYSLFYQEDLPLANKMAQDLLSGKAESNKIEYRNITKDGKIIWCKWLNSTLKDQAGKVITILSLVEDITQTKKDEARLERKNALYAFISQVNQNIVRVKDEKVLFSNSCRIAQQFGEFKAAWIGLLDKVNHKITLVNQSGIPGKELKLFENASYEIDGPQDYVLRTGKYYVSNDLTLEKWKPFGESFTQGSCMALPIRRSGEIIGTFNLYAGEPDFFNREEIALLVEVAGDISFALDMFEKARRQKETEELIVNNEKKFRHTIDNLLEGIQIHDFEWRYIYVNDAAIKSGPYSRKEMLGHTLMEKYPGIEQTDLFNTMQHCMKARVPEHFETEFIFPDGTKSYFELSIDPIPEGISVLSVDKTEQKTAKELVISNESRFRALIENSTDMITLTTVDGKILYGSPSVTKVFGYSAKEIMNIVGIDFVHPDDVEKFAENRKVIANNPGQSYSHEIRLRHKDGHWIWCEATIANMLEEPGIHAMVSNFRDISERKAAEQAQIESRNLIQTVYAASLDAIIIIDNQGIITKWDTKSESLFGWTKAEVVGRKLSQIIIPQRYRKMHDKGIEIFLKTGHGPVLGKTIEISALKKDGSEFDVSLSITSSLIDGKICFIGFIRNISEKKLLEKQREFEKNNLNALINNTNDLMWSVDLDSKLITFNQPFQDVIKFVSGKQVAKGDDVFSVVLSVEQLKRFKRSYARAFAGESFTETEHIEGPVESWSEISYYPIRKGDEIIGTACHSRDITERKKAEEKLKTSEKRLNEAQETAHLGSWALDFATQKAVWSKEACKIYGLSPKECTQNYENWVSFIHPEDLDYVMTASNAARKTLSDTDLNHRIILKDGSIKHLNSKSKFEFDQNGKPVGLHGTAHDVTEEKIAVENLRQSEERYRQIVETAQEGIWLINEDNKTVFVNRRFTEIFGYSFKEMMGKTNFDLLDEEGKIIAKEKIEQRKKGLTGDFELAYIGKSAKRIWTNVSASPILNDKGEYMGSLAMLTDITQRKNSEIEREKMTADLIQRNKDLEQFTYIVSHNLRAPVANIIGIANILDDPQLVPGEKEEMRLGLHESVTKLDDVVKDLNQILQAKEKINAPKEMIVFSELVEDIKISIKNLIDVENIEIKCNFSEVDNFLTIKSYLYSIFYNLITNSIKYRQQQIPCRIIIKSHKLKNKIQLLVSDNGMGVDLEKRGEQIFGLYRRFHTAIEGKGMGLYMVKTQVETLGGKISVQSEVDKGTEFKIEFGL